MVGNVTKSKYDFMIALIKLTAIIPFCLFSLLNASCQSKNKKINTLEKENQLSIFREKFWNSLPKPTDYTNDFEGLFTVQQKQQLNRKIREFESKSTIQICILTLDTSYVSEKQFNALALHIANKWGIGVKGKDNGITICISAGYRKIRICNGKGIERILTDEETKNIMDEFFIKGFMEGSYYKGTMDGLDALIEKLNYKIR